MEKKWDTVIPADLKRTLCKWDIYVPLVTKGLRNMRWDGHVTHTEQQTKLHTISVLKTERKSGPGRINCRCEGSIKIDLRKYGLRI
jgi:hypothetical protein